MSIKEYHTFAGEEKGSQVFEGQILVTVMGQAESETEFSSWISSVDLRTIAREMDEGDLVGQSRVVFTEHLSATQVGPRLRDLANDGEFFNYGEAEFDPDAPKVRAESRISQSQEAQGWSTETLESLSRQFIENMGLSDTYAAYLEAVAAEENSNTIEQLDGPGI